MEQIVEIALVAQFQLMVGENGLHQKLGEKA